MLFDRLPEVPFDKVGLDNAAALHLLVDHLVIEHGYRRIGFLPGHRGYETTLERTAAFGARMRHHGLQPEGWIARK